MHHLDSWIKIDQLDVTCFFISLFNAQMFRMLVHPSSGASDLFVTSWIVLLWYDACWCYVVVWHPDTTQPQPNHNVTPTHIVPEQYIPWYTQQISRNLLRMDVLTSETCWALNKEIKKQVTSSWSIFIQLLKHHSKGYSSYIGQNVSVFKCGALHRFSPLVCFLV